MKSNLNNIMILTKEFYEYFLIFDENKNGIDSKYNDSQLTKRSNDDFLWSY